MIVTTKAKKPDISSPAYMEVLKDLQSTMGVVEYIKESNRASPFFTHLASVADGVQVLAWFASDKKPADHITETLSAAQLFGNRIIREYKDK